MTAAEIAAQAKEQANTQSKERREAEVEGEKEDAARALEEEFDEMEGLEERVRRLRSWREALRVKKAAEGEGNGEVVEAESAREGGTVDESAEGAKEEEEESSDNDEDDGWGAWGRSRYKANAFGQCDSAKAFIVRYQDSMI